MTQENNQINSTEETQENVAVNVDDKCPDWAVTTIDQLRQVEIILGNVPKAIEWQSDFLKDVDKKVDAENSGPITEELSELLFGRIARGLVKEGFAVDDIVCFINARIGYKGGPKYCSAEEIKDALG